VYGRRTGIGVSLLSSVTLSTRRGGAASPFSPLSLFAAGEQGAWYDPSDINTLFQDDAGTTPVTATGQSVGRILDKSGRGNHATQANAAQKPLYDIDGTGRPFLLFDGSDDGMVTGTITPGIDKVQAFAGVRRLSGAASRMLVELSAILDSNNGSFGLLAPSAAGANSYRFASRGTATASAGTGAFVAAPDTSVMTCLGDISGDISTLRRNGGLVETSTADQGTGNYLAYPLYIGRRGGTTLPLNGRIYSLIVRFGANLSGAEITNTETWVNGKTGAY
jgi:hypothetical protein